MNWIILNFDEFINTHMRLRMHRLNLCISIGDLVRPLHKNHFFFFLKNLSLTNYSIYYVSKKKIQFDSLIMLQKIFQRLYDILDFLNLILELCLSQKAIFK